MSRSSGPQTQGAAQRSSIDDQIAFVLGNSRMSPWLKSALSHALLEDPISLLNDLEVLRVILHNRSELLIAEKYGHTNGDNTLLSIDRATRP